MLSASLVRVAVDVDTNMDAVKKVTFLAGYYKSLDVLKIYRFPEQLPVDTIGIAEKSPYEVLWDISGIPDQDQYRLSFGFAVEYKDGATFTKDMQYGVAKEQFYIIDRNPVLKGITLNSLFMEPAPVVDGALNEWRTCDSAVFHNNDNTITIWSAWDQQRLFFAARVLDDTLVALPHRDFSVSRSGEQFLRNFLWDGVEFDFDFNNNHSEFKDSGDAEICIGVDSSFVGRKDYVVNGGNIERFGAGIAYCVQRMSEGYCVEVAVPWKDAGVRPNNGKTIGFDVINKDRDDTAGYALFSSWSGVQSFNSDNPSEWGNLKLTGNKKPFKALPVASIALCFLLAAVLLVLWRKKPATAPAGNMPATAFSQRGSDEDRIRMIREYIEAHYMTEEFNLKQAADHFKMNYSYFSTLFKDLLGQTFPDYINKKRIEKAKGLLRTTNASITQIALDLGFKTPSYFNKIFKDLEGVTPSDYRGSGIQG
ncbi:MAG: hypothetical protein A2487_14800 [Candidatus Raymondbacteria bacterium RifOxyC12_full_50_8]|uniref:HTH araC/xylS-type domain-containing protein n=1 Tax=Candidatus Raymondbacteria bacterium RIFOXYD12_FULL_49_13 TaxID=1817890 RepID=A0A1F7FI14_UNCRA|nr:MAG: hypothetical protein A2248_21330 [Candidatus Raymondbacteria bacterium RIFOXYA2_FULL_49_16]OGJ97427.1 MAG: hypothetical protein A2487_14800 [Candidatus Raymondbacteria bacterium RifOxyC12_full_50_8]OGJ98650.1 MAG: hypothetical protein A2350_13980 [Candidatus Raymondbacteria bacterium RifOxyB12_full_50_8]OGK06330.1 MAG: hypothetical protein A2519_08650 [Candidatus Raymondbacteria bacterium RIFOXYD12_FULL_49_13]OGP40664.1 MAG: hypothetical protein A2324_03400 [Candidatus Raymondbacteria b